MTEREDERGVAGLRELAATAQRVCHAAAQIRGRAQSPDGSVTVAAGVDGRITDLHLAPAALQLGAGRLAALIVELHDAARSDAESAAGPLREELRADPRVARVLGSLDVPPPTSESDDYFTTFSVFGTGR